MLTVRCKECNKEITSSIHVQSCGCPNMMTVKGDSVTAVDLTHVIMVQSPHTQNKSNTLFSAQDLAYQEERRKRKIRKLDFEIR